MAAAAGSSAASRYRVALVADREEIGSLWSERPSNAGQPTLEETRLLAATADQVAQALRRDRLAAAAADAEIERRSDELRSALLDSVSHDLRTPLATIRAAAGSLADPAIDLDEAERRATARAIDDEAERMNRLVDSLLDMSRIQSGSLVTDLEVTPLTELLDPILERYRPRVTGRLTVTIPDDLPAVHVDQIFLSQALSNVLDNAVTHSAPGADLAVSAAVDRRRGRDPGRGLRAGGPGRCPAATVRSLLSRARRRHSVPPRRGPGVDRGPRADRGDGRDGPSVRERAGRARDHHPRPRRANRTRGRLMAAPDGPEVLLVEDDEPTRRMVAANLGARGYRVAEAPDGESALLRWEQRRPDLVIVDLGLPGISGLAVIHRIRTDGATPILVLSARDQERDKVAALDAGADDYLTKPFGVAELHARLRAALRRSLGPAAAGDEIRIGPLLLSTARHRVEVDGKEVSLTPREYELLKVLLAHAGRVASRARLLRAVWGAEYSTENHYLHVHVAAIRRKLAAVDPDGVLRRLIVAEPGVGYRVRDAEELAGDET